MYPNLRIKRRLTENKVIEVLQIFLKRYEKDTELVGKIVSIFKNINSSPEVQSRLEIKGLIPLFIKLIYTYNKQIRKKGMGMGIRSNRSQNDSIDLQPSHKSSKSFFKNSTAVEDILLILQDMIDTLDLMTKLSPERQEQLSRCDGIQLLISVSENNMNKIGESSLNILCNLAQSSEKNRRKLLEQGIFGLYCKYIENNRSLTKIFESLYTWF